MKTRSGMAVSMVVASSTWWCCYPSSACASQTAGLYDRHQRGQRPGALRKRIRFACSEIGQRSRWGVCRGRTRNTGCGKPTSRASCDPSLGKHGGATRLAQFSRISGCTKDWREIREIQHRRGHWPKIVVAHAGASWSPSPRQAARPRRRGDRISTDFAARRSVASGTNRLAVCGQSMSALPRYIRRQLAPLSRALCNADLLIAVLVLSPFPAKLDVVI